ncbi:uncharacterized protein JCM6883_001126 [Sporobolomyces salmoneus]|uniref:uncharacterized protein n=1 Tax=Sporobolomyces salmoneus TaxID=183962 RepID=UPI00317102E1
MHLTTAFSLALIAFASSTFATQASYPGRTPDGLIWKRYELKVFNDVPPPPHPAELAPRSIHRSKPSRYHTETPSRGRFGSEEEGGGKRRLMNIKQVTAKEVKKRALEKKSTQGGGGKKVYFDVKKKRDEATSEEGEGEAAAIEGWSWVDDDELVSVKNEESLSWSQKMEVRMRKTKPLFAPSTN